MKSISRARFEKAVEKAGCTVEIIDYDVTIDAPPGFHFSNTETASLVTSDSVSRAGERYAYALEDLRDALPLERCDPENETCVRNDHLEGAAL